MLPPSIWIQNISNFHNTQDGFYSEIFKVQLIGCNYILITFEVLKANFEASNNK